MKSRLSEQDPAYAFNSATAVKPWRTSVPSILGVAVVHFNSATAVKPGEQPYVCTALRPVLQFGHGGEAGRTLTAMISPGIPKGDFNSATAVKPWRTSSAAGRQSIAGPSIRPRRWSRGEHLLVGGATRINGLRFGHGGGAVENPRVGETNTSVATSIRPRRWSRGEP